MKKRIAYFLVFAMLFALCGCANETQNAPQATENTTTDEKATISGEITDIVLSDDGIVCQSDGVYTANDIIYYEDGHGEDYGEGSAEDAHSADEAAAHTVVHITQPGTYRISGTLSAGQIFVDLGEEAENDPNACVSLLLDNVDITCTVAPAIFFYRVYECADKDTFVLQPDLTNAGAAIFLADESFNVVKGAYVARIYEPGTTEKLHKYDAAVYSVQSMRIEGSTGVLDIEAENEGLDTELHLTVNGGNLAIRAQNDGINTNEDGISVTTINGGAVWISGGLGAEGDGIDSNGALVINAGKVYAMANEKSGDGGIDADLGIYLNGGQVIASGARNDSPTNLGSQLFMELSFERTVAQQSDVRLVSGETDLISFIAQRAFSSLILSDPMLKKDMAYQLKIDHILQRYSGKNLGFDGFIPDIEPPEEGIPTPPSIPTAPSDLTPPSGDDRQPPDGQMPPNFGGDRGQATEGGTDFILTEEQYRFSGIGNAN